MNQKNSQESKLDIVTTRLLDNFGQKLSRRGVIAQIGKLILGAVGVSIVPHLPLDRSFKAQAQGNNCCLWELCGINGFLCNNCCGGSGGLTRCPSCEGMDKGFFAWWKCCVQPDEGCTEVGFLVHYWDCCAESESVADSCKGAVCPHNPDAPDPWCPEDKFYSCTYVEISGLCDDWTYNPC